MDQNVWLSGFSYPKLALPENLFGSAAGYEARLCLAGSS